MGVVTSPHGCNGLCFACYVCSIVVDLIPAWPFVLWALKYHEMCLIDSFAVSKQLLKKYVWSFDISLLDGGRSVQCHIHHCTIVSWCLSWPDWCLNICHGFPASQRCAWVLREPPSSLDTTVDEMPCVKSKPHFTFPGKLLKLELLATL